MADLSQRGIGERRFDERGIGLTFLGERLTELVFGVPFLFEATYPIGLTVTGYDETQPAFTLESY